MRLSTVQFDPSLRDLSIPGPKGAHLQTLRMSVHGHCEAVFVGPDDADGTQDFEVCVLTEDGRVEGGGDPAGWRHAGSWRYMSGTIAHGFVRADRPAVKRGRKPRERAPVIDSAAEER